MQRIIAPGLPPWPPLLFDQQTRTAMVKARHTTWRSYAASVQVTQFSVYFVRFVIAVGVLMQYPSVEYVYFFCIAGFVAYGLLSSISERLLWSILPGFLARQVFAKRTTAYFRADAIAFRTEYYDHPIVIWRSWQGRPVHGKFIMQGDSEAGEYEKTLGTKKFRAAGYAFAGAQILSLVITTATGHTAIQVADQPNLLRCIPLLEIDGRDAAKFTVVFAAAAAFTSHKQAATPQSTTSGTDIDLA